jgi:phosphoserine phosphatase
MWTALSSILPASGSYYTRSWVHGMRVSSTPNNSFKAGKQHAEQFFQGAITYEDWAKLDASLWTGLKLQRIQQIIDCLSYTSGAKEVIAILRRKGLKVILLSAGLTLVTKKVKKEVDADDAIANELKVKNGLVTGDVRVRVSVNNKDKVLQHILKKFDLRMEECAAVGDDETLIPLFERVGLSIAFNSHSEIVKNKADFVIEGNDLRRVLPLLLG